MNTSHPKRRSAGLLLLLCLFPLAMLSGSFRYAQPQAAPQKTTAPVYYVDSKAGSDSNRGTSVNAPWKTLEKVNSVTFTPGSGILFKCGREWTGQLRPKGSGAPGRPVVLSSYGAGKKPLIAGNGVAGGAISLFNQRYWEIRNLEVTNYSAALEGGLSLAGWEKKNRSDYADVALPPQLVNKNPLNYGIRIGAEDMGALHHIYIVNVEVHGVNGYINQKDELSKQNGGIYFGITGSKTPTWFDDVLIAHSNIHDVDRTGIILSNSAWKDRSLTNNVNWAPSLNIRVQHNQFSLTGANALIVRVAKNPLIEHNLFHRCAIKASGNAGFSFNSDGAVWQFNECRYTKANTDDHDAGGIDADYKCKNTVLQYNYVHDNDYGMLVTGGPRDFNDGTVLRYNLFERDGKYPHPKNGKSMLRISGSATNTEVYNNVFYIGPDQADTKVFSHETWETSPSGSTYTNNIVYNLGTRSGHSLGKSEDNLFDTNLYFSKMPMGEPEDKNAIRNDPRFVKPGGGPAGYKLRNGSAAQGSGKPVLNPGGKDYFGNKVTPEAVNPGIYNGSGIK